LPATILLRARPWTAIVAAAPLDRELANLVAYAETGRRVVIVGENGSWGPWNAAMLGASALTAGVATLNMACGGYATGGTALLDYAVASLRGARQNVRTVLDAHVFDDRFIGQGDGVRFRRNVVEWVAGPTAVAAIATPEPASVALVGAGLVLLGTLARRRR
jgi:hypothetical protein